MDLRVLLTTFGIIFLAEMGDKTQLAAMTMAADSKKPWAVFIGASLALAAVSALGVLVGSVLVRRVLVRRLGPDLDDHGDPGALDLQLDGGVRLVGHLPQ